MKKKFGVLFAVLCGGILTIAVDYNNYNDRKPNGVMPYGRLLSDAYKTIVDYERQKGSYENIEYFKSQVNNVSSAYNPRPLTTGGIVKNKKNRRILRMARFELERFMNGYAGRIAKSDVAMMHAAFDCRVKNIEINPVLDRSCAQLFEKHKKSADRIVNAHLNGQNAGYSRDYVPNNNYQSKQNDVNIIKMKPVEFSGRKKVHHPESVPAPSVIPQPVPLKEAPQENIEPLPVPTYNEAVSQDKRMTTKELIQKIEKDIETTPQKEAPIITPIPSDPDAFNPLNYIHPSLRKKLNETQQQPRSGLEKPEQENYQTQNFEYGIKPTSPLTVNGKNIENIPFEPVPIQNFESTVSSANPLKHLMPTQSISSLDNKETLRYDATATASIKPMSINPVLQTVTIPFSTSLNMTQVGENNLKEFARILSNRKGNNKIIIKGHADQGKNSIIDMKMSLKRAQKIRNILSEFMPNTKFSLQALGASEPLDGLSRYHDKNRRVEIVIN